MWNVIPASEQPSPLPEPDAAPAVEGGLPLQQLSLRAGRNPWRDVNMRIPATGTHWAGQAPGPVAHQAQAGFCCGLSLWEPLTQVQALCEPLSYHRVSGPARKRWGSEGAGGLKDASPPTLRDCHHHCHTDACPRETQDPAGKRKGDARENRIETCASNKACKA